MNNTDSNASVRMRCHQCDGKVPDALELLLLKLSKPEVKDYVRGNENYCKGQKYQSKIMSTAPSSLNEQMGIQRFDEPKSL